MLVEVFKTQNASIIQDDKNESFVLNYHSEELSFKLCDLFGLRKKLFNLDLISLLNVDSPDTEIIYLPHLDRLLILNIQEIIELRDLLSGAFNTLQLNSEIHKILRKKV